MPVELRDVFDVAFDRIVARLESYAAAEAAEDTARAFNVLPDNRRRIGQLANGPGAYALVYLGPVRVEASSSGVATEYQQTAEYYIDCIVRAAASDGKSSDAQAGARLRYLFTQVMRGLHDPDDWNLGFTANEIQRGGTPRIEPLGPDVLDGEAAIAGGRVTLELTMGWKTPNMTTTPLTDIYVDTERWDALYQP